MRIEELINILNKNNKIEIKLEGIIDTKITIENAKTILQKEKIKILNQKEESNYVAFDMHQLMKIEENEKEIKFLFDQLQTAIIKKVYKILT